MLVAPTNIAFGGSDMKVLIFAKLCSGSVRTAPMPFCQVVILQDEGVEFLRILWNQRLTSWIGSEQ